MEMLLPAEVEPLKLHNEFRRSERKLLYYLWMQLHEFSHHRIPSTLIAQLSRHQMSISNLESAGIVVLSNLWLEQQSMDLSVRVPMNCSERRHWTPKLPMISLMRAINLLRL